MNSFSRAHDDYLDPDRHLWGDEQPIGLKCDGCGRFINMIPIRHDFQYLPTYQEYDEYDIFECSKCGEITESTTTPIFA